MAAVKALLAATCGLLWQSCYVKAGAGERIEAAPLLQTTETLVRGIAVREAKVGGLAGEVVIGNYYSPSHWDRMVGGTDSWREALKNGRAGDRDVAIAAFELGKRRYCYEMQMGLWAGGTNWFPLDFSRSANDVKDLYLRAAGDGELVYHYRRGGPTGADAWLAGETSSTPAYLRGPLATGLGLAYGVPLSDFLRRTLARHTRVCACERERVEGADCYKLTLVGDGNLHLLQYELWISPQFGYAPVRMIRFFVSKDDPRRGERTVDNWTDFRRMPNDVFLPHAYGSIVYYYESVGNAKGAWECSRRHEYKHLEIIQEPSLSLLDWFFPVGAIASTGPTHVGARLPPEQYDRVRGHLRKASAYAHASSSWVERAPKPEPALNRALTGEEIRELAQRYDSAARP